MVLLGGVLLNWKYLSFIMEISGSEIHKLTRNMIQVKSQVVQVKLMGVLPGIHGPPMVLTFKVGLPLSAAKIPRMMTTKTKTTPSKICAKHLNYYYNIFNISNRGFEIIIDINIDLFLDKISCCDDSSKKSC